MEYHITNYCILINEENEFLLVKYTDGGWAFPGGHLEHGENWKDSLLREIKEELNVNPNEVQLLSPIHINNWEYKNKYYFGTTILGKISAKKIVLSVEHDEFKWVSVSDYLLIKPAYPDYFEIVKNAYDKLGFDI